VIWGSSEIGQSNGSTVIWGSTAGMNAQNVAWQPLSSQSTSGSSIQQQ
jgi:hypothetical protein